LHLIKTHLYERSLAMIHLSYTVPFTFFQS